MSEIIPAEEGYCEDCAFCKNNEDEMPCEVCIRNGGKENRFIDIHESLVISGSCAECKYFDIDSFIEPCNHCSHNMGREDNFVKKDRETTKEKVHEIVKNTPIGTADDATHYQLSAMQPLQIMQTLMSPDEFRGFLLGNAIKYLARKDYKGQYDSDVNKARQYLYWKTLVDDGKKIDPAKDVVPAGWHMKSVLTGGIVYDID